MKIFRAARILISFVLFFSVFSLQAQTQKLTQRADVKAFVQHMVTEHHFNRWQIESWLNAAQIQPDILKTIAKPAEQLPWYKYQPIFLNTQRINDGVEFWRQHEKALNKAYKEYGVPPEVIIAIIGAETSYGKRAGQHSVLDSLVTLGFEYPPRSKFFLSELEQFFLLAREEKWDPRLIKGSYAGAMGHPQFISSSYRRFAVDFNQKGKRDLIGNMDDAIGSVGNYFKANGWKTGAPVAIPAKANGKQFKPMIASKANPKPEYTLQQMSRKGIKPDSLSLAKKYSNEDFALLALESKQKPEYWLGANNFYVITRYNHNQNYAMAVYMLSQKIKEGREKA